MTRLSWDKHCASPIRSALLQVLRVKLNSCLLIASLLMGLCSQKREGKKKKTMTSFSSVQNRGSDDDSGIINLQCLLFLGGWGGWLAVQKIAVSFFFFLNKKIKARWMVGWLVWVTEALQDFVIGTYWVISLVATRDSLDGERQKHCWNMNQSMAEKLSSGQARGQNTSSSVAVCKLSTMLRNGASVQPGSRQFYPHGLCSMLNASC